MKTKRIITATILSAGLIIGSTTGAFASDDKQPAPTPAVYAVQLAAYNTAMTTYESAMVAYKAQMVLFDAAVRSNETAYKIALKSYETAFKVVLSNYQDSLRALDASRRLVNVTFQAAVERAHADFIVARAAATTEAQKATAVTVRNSAVELATSTRNTALAALSVKHVSTRWSGFGTLARRAPYLSSALIICVGIFTAIEGWRGLASL